MADRKGTTKRGSVRRSNQGEPRARRQANARGDIQALGAAGYRDGHRVGGQKGAPAGDIAGIFNPNRVTRVQK